MALPSKMFKLKEWLTVPDAARHLSIMFGEEVNESDVLRLALDGHLKLSANFVNGAYGRRGKIVSEEETVWYELPFLLGKILRDFSPEHAKLYDAEKNVKVMASLNLDDIRFVNLEENVTSISGVWDLPLLGNERCDIEHQYQQLTGGPAIDLLNLDGTFLERQDGSFYLLMERFDKDEYCCQLARENSDAGIFLKRENEERKKKPYLHQDNYFPAGGLPEDSVLVVRTSALVDLQERLVKEDEETSNVKSTLKDDIGTKERGTWLKIIYLLAAKLADSNKSAYLKADGSFNMSKLEDVLKNKAGDLLGTDDNINNSGHGLSNDNLKKIFDEAKTLL